MASQFGIVVVLVFVKSIFNSLDINLCDIISKES
jgi:hypothetical protein